MDRKELAEAYESSRGEIEHLKSELEKLKVINMNNNRMD